MTATSVPAFLDARRSIRAFRPEPVAREALDALVAAACIAPAPHHSRPWRFVVVDGDDAKVATPVPTLHSKRCLCPRLARTSTTSST
jgi:nitroreductase